MFNAKLFSLIIMLGTAFRANAQATTGLNCNLAENASTQYCVCILNPLTTGCSYGENDWAKASLAKLKMQEARTTPSYSAFPPNILPSMNFFMPDSQTDQNEVDFKNATAALENEGVKVEVVPCDKCSGDYTSAEASPTGTPTLRIDPDQTTGQQVLTLSHEFAHHQLTESDSDLNFSVYNVHVNDTYTTDGWSVQETFAFLSDLAAAGSVISAAQPSEVPVLAATIQHDAETMEAIRAASVNLLDTTFNAFVTQEVRDQVISSTEGIAANIPNGRSVGFVEVDPVSQPNVFTVYITDPDSTSDNLLSFKCNDCDLTTPEGRAAMFDKFTDKLMGALNLLNSIDPLSPTVLAINKQNQEAIAAAMNAGTSLGQNCGFACNINQVVPVLANSSLTYEQKVATLTDISNQAVSNIPKKTCTFNGVVYNPGQTVRAYSVPSVNSSVDICVDYSSVLTCGSDGTFPGSTVFKYATCRALQPTGLVRQLVR